MTGLPDRRRFLVACATAAAALVLSRKTVFGGTRTAHPRPRPGVTAAKVLKREQLAASPALIPLFDAIREIPQVIDGIRCNCGCTNPPEFYSLLSCYESKGMARDCAICQGQGRLAVRLHKEGKTLNEIRAAIDARFA